jgi:hypothetical protein
MMATEQLEEADALFKLAIARGPDSKQGIAVVIEYAELLANGLERRTEAKVLLTDLLKRTQTTKLDEAMASRLIGAYMGVMTEPGGGRGADSRRTACRMQGLQQEMAGGTRAVTGNWKIESRACAAS